MKGAHGTAEPLEIMRDQHRRTLWAPWTIALLGAWLASSPFVLSYGSRALVWSDVASGILLVALGLRSLDPDAVLARWGACFVGLWLLFAPLLFWAPTAYEYNNDTVVGALVVSFSILIPGMPSRRHHEEMTKPGPEMPPGWTYNPSSWLQRGPLVALAFASFLLARHLTAFQLGHVSYAWDPFFGDQTMRVLQSDVSRAWPVSDAGLGAVAYLIEALGGLMGNEQRWRNMPWMAGLFGLLVVPLGITSIVLVMLQPIGVGAWCALCLLTAFFMLVMLPLSVDELVATVQFLVLARREGQSVWRVFWFGGTLRSEERDVRTPRLGAGAGASTSAAIWGVTLPPGLALAAALGMATLAIPDTLGVAQPAAIHVWLAGSLIAVMSATAWSELARPLRLLNVPLALWLLGAAWLAPGSSALASWVITLVALAILVASLPRGTIREAYGDATAFAKWRPHVLHRVRRGRRPSL